MITGGQGSGSSQDSKVDLIFYKSKRPFDEIQRVSVHKGSGVFSGILATDLREHDLISYKNQAESTKTSDSQALIIALYTKNLALEPVKIIKLQKSTKRKVWSKTP